ncbi:Phosphatidylserine/phosphatidylglycerophosphate/cardiolinpin synthase -like protein [Brachionus plicatilis]|uniref:Phosphatidylserine/phosphatidylglycerophosphate/ cardiolinpin synthase-like protein n=1 Tax=Brachionus plicatilis TaxID=10195 RepID=A0A3M7PXU2_BRAPC|nr:Phosphatidylserine/phosphatidylglycerophosphate/cardiolinpin synthase -like protein [Brachionus plicatilis]
MKAFLVILFSLCFGSLLVNAKLKQTPAEILSNPTTLAYIAQKLQENPEALQAVLFFLVSNGINIQALIAGDVSQLSDQTLADKFKDYLQENLTLRAFVIDILNHLGIQLPRVDWSSVGSAVLDALPVIIDNIPNIISVISLFGKRDLNLQEILSSTVVANVLQVASQYGISLQTILLAVNAIQDGDFSSLLNLLPPNFNFSEFLSALNIQQIIAGLDIQSILSTVSSYLPQDVDLQTIISYITTGNWSALLALVPENFNDILSVILANIDLSQILPSA